MDELLHRESVIIHRGLLAAALMVLACAGCEQLGLGKNKGNPVVPPPPERKLAVESTAKSAKPGGGPAKLDDSAASDGSAEIPNAPAIAGSQPLAGPRSLPDSPATGNSRGAGSPGNPAGTGDAAADEDSSEGGELSESDDSQASPGGTKRRQIIQVESREEDDVSNPATAPESGADLVSPIELEGDGTKLQKGEVAVIVNGAPIFSDDVLRTAPQEYLMQLAQIEMAVKLNKATPDVLRKSRNQLIAMCLKQHIDQELLLQGLRTRLKEEQLTGITKQLDAQFNSVHLPAYMKKAKVGTEGELELELRKQGSSIEAQRSTFRNRELARQYMHIKAMAHDGYDLPDVRKYYLEHIEDYAVTAKAKWEQIQLKFTKNGGKEGARKKADEILKRLDSGEVFAVVAKECSNGVTAAKGGLWGWTEEGSLKTKEIEEAVFEQPVGQIGPPIETSTSIDIIRVIDRTDAAYQPFETVEDQIKAQLKEAASQKRYTNLMKELNENATIERLMDET